MRSQEKLEREVGVRLQAGDTEGAAARLLEACGPGVRGYLRVCLPTERQLRDAYSSFTECVWQNLRRYRGEPGLRVWAYRQAYCSAKQYRGTQLRPKRASTSRKTESGARALSRTRAATLEPLGVSEDAEVLRAELSLEEQTLLTLRVDRGFGWEDIGCVLGKSRAGDAMQRRYERLVRRLHRTAIARGLIEEEPLPRRLDALSLTRRSTSREI
ncbi:MAG TPA: hypothetical protein VJR89_03055 [Polyangiales bacterium]|nr:hypothetical protein [Polyangiales bacterium]